MVGLMDPRSAEWRGHYAIVDPDHAPHGVLETADAVLAGGCAVLQLRFKGSDDREHLALARALSCALTRRNYHHGRRAQASQKEVQKEASG